MTWVLGCRGSCFVLPEGARGVVVELVYATKMPLAVIARGKVVWSVVMLRCRHGVASVLLLPPTRPAALFVRAYAVPTGVRAGEGGGGVAHERSVACM